VRDFILEYNNQGYGKKTLPLVLEFKKMVKIEGILKRI
jgi:hypothetical protein